MEMKMLGFWVLFGLIVLSEASDVVNDIPCAEAIATLSPCNTYLIGNDGKPSPSCCLAVQRVNDVADTPETRKQLCVCFKEAGPRLGVKADKAKQLPGLCHIKVPVPIDPNVDCNKIH